MKRHHDNRRGRSPRSEIARLEEAIRRESDKIERERLRQHLEHWIRTQNNSR
jgi:hypothetical protein